MLSVGPTSRAELEARDHSAFVIFVNIGLIIVKIRECTGYGTPLDALNNYMDGAYNLSQDSLVCVVVLF